MVKALLIICLFISLNSQAAELSIALNTKTVELGKYLTAKVTFKGTVNPGEINLSPWNENFFVDAGSVNEDISSDNNIITQYSARLYPLRAGLLTLKAIALGGTYSQPIDIQATPSIREGIDTTPLLQEIPKSIWIDQPLHLQVNMPRFHQSNISASEAFESNDFDVYDLPKLTIKKSGKKTPSIDQFQWLLFAPRAGLFDIQIPRLEQRGRSRLRYYLDKQAIEVNPLPSYLPSTLIIGKPRISSIIDSSQTPHQWVVTIQNHGRLPEEAFGLRKQLAQLSKRSANEVEVQTLRVVGIGNKPAKQVYRVDLPDYQIPNTYLPWKKDTSIKLAYFETKNDFDKPRLQYLEHPLPTTWRLPPSWQYLLFSLFFLSFLLATTWLIVFYRKYHNKHRHQLRIDNAQDANTKRHIILNNGQFQYRSLKDWAGTDKKRQKLAKTLNYECYSRFAKGPKRPML